MPVGQGELPWEPVPFLTRRHYSNVDPLDAPTEFVLDQMPPEVTDFEGWEKKQREIARDIASVVFKEGWDFAQRYAAWMAGGEEAVAELPDTPDMPTMYIRSTIDSDTHGRIVEQINPDASREVSWRPPRKNVSA